MGSKHHTRVDLIDIAISFQSEGGKEESRPAWCRLPNGRCVDELAGAFGITDASLAVRFQRRLDALFSIWRQLGRLSAPDCVEQPACNCATIRF